MINWLFWAIPHHYVKRYFVMVWLVLFFLPGVLLGVRLTLMGLVINYVWFDIVFYGWVKFKEKLEGDQ